MSTRVKTIGNVLVAAGAVIGVGTVSAIATGYEIQLTTEMVHLLIYKAFGAAAVGLMIAGTWIGRSGTAKREEADEVLLREPEGVPGQLDVVLVRQAEPAELAATIYEDPSLRREVAQTAASKNNSWPDPPAIGQPDRQSIIVPRVPSDRPTGPE